MCSVFVVLAPTHPSPKKIDLPWLCVWSAHLVQWATTSLKSLVSIGVGGGASWSGRNSRKLPGASVESKREVRFQVQWPFLIRFCLSVVLFPGVVSVHDRVFTPQLKALTVETRHPGSTVLSAAMPGKRWNRRGVSRQIQEPARVYSAINNVIPNKMSYFRDFSVKTGHNPPMLGFQTSLQLDRVGIELALRVTFARLGYLGKSEGPIYRASLQTGAVSVSSSPGNVCLMFDDSTDIMMAMIHLNISTSPNLRMYASMHHVCPGLCGDKLG